MHANCKSVSFLVMTRSVKARLAFLEEGCGRFLNIAAEAIENLVAVFQHQRLLQRGGVEVFPHCLFGGDQAVGAEIAEAFGQYGGRIAQLGVAGLSRNESPVQRLMAVDDAGGQHHIVGTAAANQARQGVTDTEVAAGHSEANKLGTECGALGGNAQVAGQR